MRAWAKLRENFAHAPKELIELQFQLKKQLKNIVNYYTLLEVVCDRAHKF